MAKSNSNKAPRGRLAIHRYVHQLVARHGGESYCLPSSRELAVMFGVSRSTVTRELEHLVEHGLLVTRQGIGTFLAPVSPQYHRKSVVGILIGAGNHYCYGEHFWRLMSATGEALVSRGCMVRPLSILSTKSEELIEEVKENFVDGLIWFEPPCELLPRIGELARELPLAAFCAPDVKMCNSVSIDYTEESYQEGKRLLQEGRRSFWSAAGIRPEVYLDGYRRAWEEAGIPFAEGTVFNAVLSLPEELREALRAGKRPDVFQIHTRLRAETIRLLQEFDIDFKKECRLIGDSVSGEIPGFAGWCHEQPYRKIADALGEIMLRLLSGDQRMEHRELSTRHFSVNL